MNSLILKTVDIFRGLYTKIGVNYNVMRLIVENKLIMDSRRGTELNKKEGKNSFFISLIMYALVGIASAPIILLNVEPIIKMSLYFSFFMIMILSVFISDFSSIMLDISDKEILETKGVDVKTLNASKFTHILIYMTLLTGSIGLGAILCSFRYGLKFTLLFILNLFLINLFMIIITTIFYFVILKFFSGEKLKDVLSTFQVLFVLVFVVGYQILIRAFSFVNLQFTYTPKPWNALLPPMWFGSGFNILEGKNVDNFIIFMLILSVVVPIISIIVYIKSIPKFEYYLQKLNNNTYSNKKNKDKLSFKVSKILCKDNEERAFFNFVYDILKKDREFKTKVYPSLVMGAFMPFLMLASLYDNQGIKQFIMELRNGPFYLYIYLFILMSLSISTTLRFSKEYEASWIYDVIPIKSKKNIYSATFKSSIYTLMAPIFIAVSIGFIVIFSSKIILDLVIVLLATILASMVSFKIDGKVMPFSCEYKNTNTASNLVSMFKVMFFVGILVLMHFLVYDNLIIQLIYIISLIAIIKLTWNKVFDV